MFPIIGLYQGYVASYFSTSLRPLELNHIFRRPREMYNNDIKDHYELSLPISKMTNFENYFPKTFRSCYYCR